MTKKKRELIEILLDNVNPEDWPKKAVYAAQDKETLTWGKWVLMFYSDFEIPHVNVGGESFVGEKVGREIKLPVLCENWNKTIVHRDEFVKRWNERNAQDDKKTPQQIALEKFGTGWHENEGVQPVDDEILIEVMFNHGAESLEPINAKNWSFSCEDGLGEKESSFTIMKWRVHSDEKESQADLAAKSLSDGMQKINSVLPTEQQAFDGFKNACDTLAKYMNKHNVGHVEKIKPHPADDDHMEPESVSKSPLQTQIGGSHYTKLAIQPMRYSMENGLDALQHTIIKYVTRFRDKAGIEDLEKAKHCIDMLIEFEHEKESK